MTALTTEDAQLVTRLKRGDAAAARELYERHGNALLRFGMAMSDCRQTAEDVVHDTFLELLRQPSRFDPARGSVQGYLFGIARHRLSRVARVSMRETDAAAGGPFGTDEASAASQDGDAWAGAEGAGSRTGAAGAALAQGSEEDTGEVLDRARNIELVRAAVSDLPRVHREVIALCDLEELPYATVASILGCPIGTVRSRLSRARALLATRLDVPDEPVDDERRDTATDDALGMDASALDLDCRGTLT